MMFCHKCGAQIAEGAAFCHKCGAAVVYANTEPQIPSASRETINLKGEAPAELTQKMSDVSVQVANGTSDFKEFVDNHIRTTTKFQSADELLNSNVPLPFVWGCLGVSFILGAITFNPVVLLFALLLGYVAARLVCGVKNGRCAFRYTGKHVGNINTDDVIRFLNENLTHTYPHFHEWGYRSRETYSVRSAVHEAVADSIRESTKEVAICTTFGEDQRRVSVLIIRPDPTDATSGTLEYFADAENRVEGASFLSHDMGFQKYKCMVKTAPILQAAMKYYLDQHIED